MQFHPEEYTSAKIYWQGRPFPNMTAEQMKLIKEKGNNMIKFHLRCPLANALINISVFFLIFAADYWVLLRLGLYFQSAAARGIIIGLAHSYLLYSLTVFTLHEGAAHKLIFPEQDRFSQFAAKVANNLNRIALAESDYYAKNHMFHHANFATPKDGEFLNFVFAKRLWKVFIPFASIVDISDFKAHSGLAYTPSRMLSVALFLLYHGTFAVLMSRRFGWWVPVIALFIISLNVTFWLDRLRQFTEHNAMPLNNNDGARDLGLGFWGLLIGGGPWGQPCHWSHHLYPGLPWYNQLRMHNFVKTILTPEQKKVFLLEPVIGFPKTLFNLLKTTGQFEKAG